jgi:hypothetical protein
MVPVPVDIFLIQKKYRLHWTVILTRYTGKYSDFGAVLSVYGCGKCLKKMNKNEHSKRLFMVYIYGTHGTVKVWYLLSTSFLCLKYYPT